MLTVVPLEQLYGHCARTGGAKSSTRQEVRQPLCRAPFPALVLSETPDTLGQQDPTDSCVPLLGEDHEASVLAAE